MDSLALWLALILAAGLGPLKPRPSAAPGSQGTAPVTGPFTAGELKAFAALEPIDTHTHAFVSDPAFLALLHRLHMHILDICVIDDHSPFERSLEPQLDEALAVVHASQGHAALCTTFDPYRFQEPGFAEAAIRQINRDFENGAVAVKVWKNVGMELKNTKGAYVMPDDPLFQPIYRDIAAHHKTLIAHVADPDTIWQPPDPRAPDYSYYMEHPEWYMFRNPHPPSKQAILKARDHLLEMNPDLRVVGAHLGSMEADFSAIARHLDRYPNFCVDLAARMPYVIRQPRAELVAFMTKYQDRLLYATDLGFHPGEDASRVIKEWETTYARDWRFFATSDLLDYEGRRVQGIHLPPSILRKLYHQNALRSIPGILPATPAP